MSANPLHNSNKLKLGIFGTNGKGGAQTLAPEAWKPTWKGAVETAVAADRAGFEAIVGYARWKGYIAGEPDHPSGVVFDSFTFAAGLAQVTQHAALFATSHAPTVHPITCAKQCATIDIMSGGRLGLNVVGGWNKPELEMFGAALKEHDARYDQLDEWLTIIRKLWSNKVEFDFDGAFYNVKAAMSRPQPLQKRIPIMNAGGSDRGMEFAAQHADLCFVILQTDDRAAIKAQIDKYKMTAREKFGRNVQVWTYCPVVQRDTREEAAEYLHYFAETMQDRRSVDAWAEGMRTQTKIFSPEKIDAFRLRFAAGVGGNILMGTASDIADQMQSMSEAGLDGVLCTWVDFHDGIRRFTAKNGVMQELEKRGLRAPFSPETA
jgi:dimethylsulfone monooxygenase